MWALGKDNLTYTKQVFILHSYDEPAVRGSLDALRAAGATSSCRKASATNPQTQTYWNAQARKTSSTRGITKPSLLSVVNAAVQESSLRATASEAEAGTKQSPLEIASSPSLIARGPRNDGLEFLDSRQKGAPQAP